MPADDHAGAMLPAERDGQPGRRKTHRAEVRDITLATHRGGCGRGTFSSCQARVLAGTSSAQLPPFAPV
jgi:hypothetical protein